LRRVDKWNRLPEEIQQAATQEDLRKRLKKVETVMAQRMDKEYQFNSQIDR
jgi:hypothetical protein